MSMQSDIAQAIIARLQNSAYFSAIYWGARSVDADDIPAAVLHENGDVPADDNHANKVKLNLSYNVEGLFAGSRENPNEEGHVAIAEIKQHLFTDDLRLGGRVMQIKYQGSSIAPRDQGSDQMACQVRFEISAIETLQNP